MLKTDNMIDGGKPSFKRSFWVMAGLGVLFGVVYQFCNWFTSTRGDVGTWYYEWEAYIPFVPWMIVPYMLIDLFFVIGPFICRSVKEQNLFARRIIFTVFGAGVCYLIFPLTLAVERPAVEGMLGVVFDQFREMDLPYNLCPSLHIALRTVLAELFGRHTKGWWRVGSHAWFCLIGISTLLTYQHHVVDVAGGFLFATLIFYFVRDAPFVVRAKGNDRVGIYYGVVSFSLVLIGVLLGSWWLWLLWPGLATGLVACGYFKLGVGIYGKADGRLPMATRLVLGPVLFGQYLSLVYYGRQCRAWDEVCEGLWLGRVLSEKEALFAVASGVTAVVDLTVNFSERKAFRGVNYLGLPVLDLTGPTKEQVAEAVRFIGVESKKGIVYVHCKVGYSRSGAIVGVYLLESGLAGNADEGMEMLRGARGGIVIRPEAEEVIRGYAGCGVGGID